jgi:hypothetical protein
VHVIFGVAVVALNAAAGLIGAVSWARRRPSVVFWYVLRAAQVAVVVQALIGLALLAEGRQPADDLHFIYGVSPLVVTFATESMRVGSAGRELEHVPDVEALSEREQAEVALRIAQRETGVMTIGVLLILTLALRAFVSAT